MNSSFKILSGLLLSSSILASGYAYAEKINSIKIEGNKRIESQTILNYLDMKVGSEFSSEIQSSSLKSLYRTNFFENIKINFANGQVVINVSEAPLVSKVVFSGNSRVKNATLTKEVSIHQGSSLNDAVIKRDVDRIKQIYRRSGRYAIIVKPVVERLENNRAKVTFNISEGPKTRVRYINFVGNKAYKDSELRSVIFTKQEAWFRFLDSSDTYDPEKIEYDKHLIKVFYTSLGYADARVISGVADLSKTKEYFTLTYTVEEGEIYNFGKIDIESKLDEVDAEQFRKLITIKESQKYSSTKLDLISDDINAKLADLGYSGALVYADEVKDREGRVVDVKFIIEKGSKVFID